MTCFAPLLLMGYLFTMHPNPSHVSNVDGYMVEIQTCEKGLGLHLRAQSAGLYSFGMQYGLQHTQGKWSFTLQPRAGLSSSSEKRYELPLYQQFELGAQFIVGYGEHMRMGVDYWHLSNAGMKDPNIGIDMMGVVMGWRF